MKRKFYRRFGNAPKKLLRELKSLTLKNYPMSELKFRLKYQEHFKSARLFLEYKGQELIGWAIVEHEEDTEFGRHYRARFYVKNKYRRKGVGTRLVERVKKELRPMKKKILVCDHSRNARVFFDATNMNHRWDCWNEQQ